MTLSNKKNQKNSKKILLAVALIVALTGVAGLYVFISSKNSSNRNSSEFSEANPKRDKPVSSSDNTSNDSPNTATNDQNTPSSPSLETATINIPSYQSSNSTITVNVAINEVWSNGECVMELSGPSTTIARSNVFPQAQISGCQLEATDLPKGNYTISVYAVRDGKKTNTETLRISV